MIYEYLRNDFSWHWPYKRARVGHRLELLLVPYVVLVVVAPTTTSW